MVNFFCCVVNAPPHPYRLCSLYTIDEIESAVGESAVGMSKRVLLVCRTVLLTFIVFQGVFDDTFS